MVLILKVREGCPCPTRAQELSSFQPVQAATPLLALKKPRVAGPGHFPRPVVKLMTSKTQGSLETAGLFRCSYHFKSFHIWLSTWPFITIHHHPSPSITIHHHPSPSITIHHHPSPSITIHHHPSPSWQVPFMDSLALRRWEMDSMSSWMCLNTEALGFVREVMPFPSTTVRAVTDGYWGSGCGQVVLQWWSSKLPWQTESIFCKRTGWTTTKRVGTTNADYTRLVFSHTRARQMQRALLGRKKRIYFDVLSEGCNCNSTLHIRQISTKVYIPIFFLGVKTAMMNPGLVFHHISRFQPR